MAMVIGFHFIAYMLIITHIDIVVRMLWTLILLPPSLCIGYCLKLWYASPLNLIMHLLCLMISSICTHSMTLISCLDYFVHWFFCVQHLFSFIHFSSHNKHSHFHIYSLCNLIDYNLSSSLWLLYCCIYILIYIIIIEVIIKCSRCPNVLLFIYYVYSSSIHPSWHIATHCSSRSLFSLSKIVLLSLTTLSKLQQFGGIIYLHVLSSLSHNFLNLNSICQTYTW